MRHCNGMRCPYLVELYDVFETTSHLYMVTESGLGLGLGSERLGSGTL